MDEVIDDRAVLVGVDGSAPSIEALKYGARVATALGVPLDAVITSDPPLAEARAVLNEAVGKAFGNTPPDRLTATVLIGAPAASLVHLSDRYQMLVLGSRGHGGFVGMLLGSVSTACAQYAHCPVLIVRKPIGED